MAHIAIIVDIVPNKVGSIELWFTELALDLSNKSHSTSIYTYAPVHPEIQDKLSAANAQWHDLAELSNNMIKGIIELSKFDVISLSSLAPRSKVALMSYLAVPAKIIFIDHFSSPEIIHTGGSLLSFVRRMIDRLSIFRISKFVGVSEFVTNRIRQRFSVNEDRAVTVYNGIEPNRFSLSAIKNNDPPIIFAVCHLIPEKGIDLLIRSFAQVRACGYHCKLIIAGDGPERKNLEQLSEQFELTQHIEFLGLRDDVPELLKTADIFVHPAFWQEAFGLAIAEAMASGCAIVACNTGALPELIIDGECGLLVDVHEKDSLKNALISLLENRDLRQRLGTQAIKRINNNFDLETCVKKHNFHCLGLIGQD